MTLGPILVTGATGFAGGHLLEHLAGRVSLVGWGRAEPAPVLAPLAQWERIDLLDRDRVRAAIATLRPSAIYHCAGAPHVAGSWNAPAHALSSNVLATHYLLDAVRRAGLACRVLITGSATVYASSDEPIAEDDLVAPTSPYALSKLAQEQLGVRAARDEGMDVILTRSFNHTGPRQSDAFVAPAIAHQIAVIERGEREPVIRVGNLDAVRDLTDVRDTVRAYIALMERGAPGTIYNVASGIGHSIRSVVEGLVARSRVPVRVELDPARLRASDTPILVGDTTRLRKTTGWTPDISFGQMLDDLLAYWRTQAP